MDLLQPTNVMEHDFVHMFVRLESILSSSGGSRGDAGDAAAPPSAQTKKF